MRALALLLLLSSAAQAQEGPFAWAHAGPDDALNLSVPGDFILAVGGLALWGGSQAVRNSIAPSRCNLCGGPDDVGLPGDPLAGRADLNGLDAWFHDRLTGALVSRETADRTSDLLAYGLAPLGALSSAFFATGPRASRGAWARTTVILAESVALSGVLGQAVKLGLARKRPFIRYGHGEASGSYSVSDAEGRFSLPSGHTSASAALLGGAAMCATLQGSEAAPWLWASAGAVTAFTGALRIMAEKHYFTDVAAGAILGAASGLLVPWLHRTGGVLDGARLSPAPSGLALIGNF